MNRLTLFCGPGLLLSLIAAVATAQPVYRSIDAGGNVTFSDTPTEDAVLSEAIKVPPRLSDDEIERTHREVEALVERANELHRERLLQRQAQRQSAQQAAPPTWRAAAAEPHDQITAHRWQPAAPGFRRFPHHRPALEHIGNGDHPAFRPGRGTPRPEQPELSQQVLPRGL